MFFVDGKLKIDPVEYEIMKPYMAGFVLYDGAKWYYSDDINKKAFNTENEIEEAFENGDLY